MTNSEALLIAVESVQNILLSRATGGGNPQDDNAYRSLRTQLLSESQIEPLLPRFVITCRDLSAFWSLIKQKFSSYQERRDYIWSEFAPLLAKLEGRGESPADAPVSEVLNAFDVDSVHAVWRRALERRNSDPEGAITSARTLLETVCKHILDESAAPYDAAADLPKLYSSHPETLNAAS